MLNAVRQCWSETKEQTDLRCCPSPTPWIFCGSSSGLCGLGEGDCRGNEDCEAGLICGVDNCEDFHPGISMASHLNCCINNITSSG